MRYQVEHQTIYRYSDPVPLCQNQAHLTPRCFYRQQCERAKLVVHPTPTALHSWVDYFGNAVTFFSIEESHSELIVSASSQVQLVEPDYPPLEASPSWEVVRGLLAHRRDPELISASQFTFDSPHVTRSQAAADYARPSMTANRPLLDAVMDLTGRIFQDFKYDPRATSVQTTSCEVFQHRRGVCQDFAQLQLACLRSWGLAARYVSGYLLTEPPPDQVRLVGADASHAWVAVYCPPLGWFDFDPTNNTMPRLRHVTVAWGRDYGDVRPVQGVFLGGGHHSMSVRVHVAPISEQERPDSWRDAAD